MKLQKIFCWSIFVILPNINNFSDSVIYKIYWHVGTKNHQKGCWKSWASRADIQNRVYRDDGVEEDKRNTEDKSRSVTDWELLQFPFYFLNIFEDVPRLLHSCVEIEVNTKVYNHSNIYDDEDYHKDNLEKIVGVHSVYGTRLKIASFIRVDLK